MKAQLRDDKRAKAPPEYEFRALTLADVLAPDFGRDQLYVRDQQGYMARVRRNGMVKTWKRDPSRVEVPVKFGLYEAFRVRDPGELYVREGGNPRRRHYADTLKGNPRRRGKRNPPRFASFVYGGKLPQWILDAGVGEGDRIEFQQYAGRGMHGPEYRPATGRVHMLSPHGAVVVLPGDRFGARPVVVTGETFLRIVSRAKRNPRRRGGRSRFRHRRVRAPGRFARSSLRTIKSGKARVIVGHLRGERKRTRRGRRRLTVQAVLTPKRARGNPRKPYSESEAWRRVLDTATKLELDGTTVLNVGRAQTIKAIARMMLGQVRRGVHENPMLAVVGANPPMGRVVEIRYHRDRGAHPGYYKHSFRHRPVMVALNDGSLKIGPH